MHIPVGASVAEYRRNGPWTEGPWRDCKRVHASVRVAGILSRGASRVIL